MRQGESSNQAAVRTLDTPHSPSRLPDQETTDTVLGIPIDDRAVEREAVYDAVANERRRNTLRTLKHMDADTIDVRELANEVAELEYGEPAEQLSASQRKNTYVALQQFHLEKLEEAGLLEYHPASSTVASTTAVDELELTPNPTTYTSSQWSVTHLAVSLLGLSILSSHALKLVPDTLTGSVLSVAVLAIVILVSASHWYTQKQTAQPTPPSLTPGE